AAKLGYAPTVPIAYLDSEKAPKDVKEALASALTPVIVAANRASRSDIVLEKGAVISGTVRFDDGEPYSQATVSLLHKDQSGKWKEFAAQEGLFSSPGGGGAPTDDQGNFRLTGLPSGDYLIRTTVSLSGAEVNSPGVDSQHEPDYRWDVYFGNGIRPSDAKIIKLKDSEQSNGNMIEIPLARLHSISGIILNLETGAPINRGDVELHNADDDSLCTVTALRSAAGQFHFPYVAEGEYTLKVRKASDVSPGARSHDEKPLRTYADASQPILVKGEMNGISIPVKPSTHIPAVTTQ
ncbi:MAG TPA: carboxypeptidase-like regulatory domain-containing protein, partial [Acidobacteriaceae bacterium]